jgi:hypothetical protein
MEKLTSEQWETVVAWTLTKLDNARAELNIQIKINESLKASVENGRAENETIYRSCADYQSTIRTLESKVRDLESRLPSKSAVEANPEIDPSVKQAMDKLRAEIADPKHTGGYSFIDAIKIVRGATHWGLKEAKVWTEKNSGYKARY